MQRSAGMHGREVSPVWLFVGDMCSVLAMCWVVLSLRVSALWCVPRPAHVPALFFGQPSLHPGFGLKAGLACRRVSCCVSHLPCLSVVSSCAVGLRACFRVPLWSVTWFPVCAGFIRACQGSNVRVTRSFDVVGDVAAPAFVRTRF